MATGFSVFVNIGAKVASSVGSSIGQVEKQFSGLSKKLRMQSLETKLALKDMQATSHAFGAALAGIGIGHGIKAVIGDGAEYQNEIFALKNAGRTVGEVAEGIKKAHEVVAALPTTTFSENLKLLNETTGAFGDYHHALDNLGFNAKLGSMMKASFGDKMGDEGTAFNDLVRAFEIRGTANNPATYQKEVGELYKSMVFTRGNVNPSQFLLFAQQANPAIKNLSERFLTKIAPSLIQELGGDRAGTSLTAFRNTIMGKVNDKKQAEAWMNAGLLDPKQAIIKNGTPLAWKAGAVKGTDLALSDPLKWAEDIGIPAMQKLGVDINNQMEVSKTIGTMFRNNNAQRFAEAIFQARDRQRLHKDEGLINMVPGFDKQYNDSLGNITVGVDAVHHSFQNLFAALSGPLLEPASRALVALATGINKVAVALAEHPMLGGGLGIAGGILAGVAGLKAFRATLGLLGLAGIGPLKLIKAELFSIGAMASGTVAAGLRGLSAVVMTLVSPMRALAFAAGMARSALMMTGVGLALAGIVTAGTFIANNWEGLGRFFTAFGESVRVALGPQTMAAFQPLIESGVQALNVFQQLTGTIDPAKWTAWGTAAGQSTSQFASDMQTIASAITAAGAAWAAFSAYSAGPGDMLAGTRREIEGIQRAWAVLTQPLDFTHTFDGLKAAANFDWAGLGRSIGSSIASGVTGTLSGIGARIKGMFSFGGGGAAPASPSTTWHGPHRALGGPVGGGSPYLVGERGPELFVPGRSGRIETNAAVYRLMGARGAAATSTTVNHGDIHVAVTVHAKSNDAEGIGREVSKALQWELRKMQRRQSALLSD